MATSGELQKQCSNLKSAKNTLQKRIRQLQRIMDNIYNDLDSDTGRIRSAESETENAFRSGLSGILNKETVISQIHDLEELSVSSDGDMNDVLGNIESEIARCTREVSSLDSQIAAKQNEVRTAKENERKAQEASQAGGVAG